MRGAMKWPLGDRISPQVITMQGWAYVLVGASSGLLTVLLLLLPSILRLELLEARWITVMTLGVAVVLLVAGCIPYIRSVPLSRR